MSQTAFVSGASGFVGSHLARELHAQGWEVHALVRPGSSLDELPEVPVTVHRGDLTDRDSVLAAMPKSPAAVFHVAASTNFWSGNNAAQDRVNIGGTHNMLDAAEAAGARRLIYTSSFSTWGFQNTRINEDSPRSAATDWINYVSSKHAAEQAVSQAAAQGRVDGVILNPAHILGPGDYRNWSRMIQMAQAGKLFAAPPGAGNFCDVREVARAHIRAFHSGRGGEKYLLGGEYATFADVVKLVGEVLGRRVPQRAAPAWIMKGWALASTAVAAVTGKEPNITPESAAMVTYHMACDSTRARNELDYRFTPIRTLIEDTVEWMKKKGMLS